MITPTFPASSTRPASSLLFVCAAVLAMAGTAAWGDDDPNPYSLGVTETVSHDTNVFRAKEGSQGASDWYSTTGIIGTVNQPIGRERLLASGEFDFNKFKHNTQLDGTSHALNVEGDWATVGNLSGEVGYSNVSQLYRYSLDSARTYTQSNHQNVSSEFARFHLGMVTRWSLNAGVTGQNLTYTAQPFRFRNLKRYDATVGLSYEASSDLTTSLSYRHARGQYPNYFNGADDFTRNDIILGLIYTASGASVIRINAGVGRENHSSIQSRDLRTWNGDAQWIWTPTGRTQLILDFTRDNDTGSSPTLILGDEADAQERATTSLRLNYELTSKIKLHANGLYSRRRLDTAFSTTSTIDQRGSDRLVQEGLGVDYQAARSLQLGCNIAHERRSVEGDVLSITYPYSDTVVSCLGKFMFN